MNYPTITTTTNRLRILSGNLPPLTEANINRDAREDFEDLTDDMFEDMYDRGTPEIEQGITKHALEAFEAARGNGASETKAWTIALGLHVFMSDLYYAKR